MGSDFQLPDEVSQKIYLEEIEPPRFEFTPPVDSPVIVIIGGQPGAGKTTVRKKSSELFNRQDFVEVSTDDLRAYHPKYEDICSVDDKLSAERTHHDASIWSQKLLERCIQTKRNVLMEGVLKDPNKIARIAEMAEGKGYRVIVRFLAVHERDSLSGIHERYEMEKRTRKHGRFVPIEYHDACYAKLLETIEALEERKSADIIEVFSREGELLYRNEQENGQWKEPVAGRQKLENGRSRKLTRSEMEQWEQGWQRVIDMVNERSATPQELDDIETLRARHRS